MHTFFLYRKQLPLAFLIAALFMLPALNTTAQDYPEDDNNYESEPSRQTSQQKEDRQEKSSPDKPQHDKDFFNWNDAFVGGSFGAQFGSVVFVNASPNFGYYFTDNIVGGIGATYMFLHDKRLANNLKMHVYGGRLFGRYHIIEGLFAHAEYEVLRQQVVLEDVNVTTNQERDGVTVPSLLLGAGYSQSLGGRSSFNIMILFNVLESDNSLYSNPIFRAGFNIGL